MAYNFVQESGTIKTVEEVVEVIRQVGTAKSFMGLTGKLNSSAVGPGSFGPFAPTANDDPFATGAAPAKQIGWRRGNSVTNSWGMTLEQGYRVIFSIHDRGSARAVFAKVDGSGFKGEVKKFVDQVFRRL